MEIYLKVAETVALDLFKVYKLQTTKVVCSQESLK